MNTQLPEELLTINPVMKARGCKSRTTIWNETKDGTFPAPDKIIKRIRYWRASTIRKWQDVVIDPLTTETPYQKIEKRRRRFSTDGPAN